MNKNEIYVEQESPFDVGTTVEKLLESAKKNEWQNTAIYNLKQPISIQGNEIKPLQVIEICKNDYSNYMLEKDHEKFLSLIMMPCRISVYEKENGKTYISLLNMAAMVTGLPPSENKIIRDASQGTFEIVKSVIGEF